MSFVHAKAAAQLRAWQLWAGHRSHSFCWPKTSEVSVQEVQRKFEKYGDVTLSRIVRNPVNGESRGFGFVDMKDDEGADEVRLSWHDSNGIQDKPGVCKMLMFLR